MVTFWLRFLGRKSTKNLPKTKDFNVLWLKLYWSKTHEIKSKFKFIFYFTFEIINIHNRSCKMLFFLPLLDLLFNYSNLLKVLNWSCTSQKIVCSHQNSFFLQNKGLNNPIWVGRHTKKQFKVVQVTPTLIPLEDISVKIIGRGLLYDS